MLSLSITKQRISLSWQTYSPVRATEPSTQRFSVPESGLGQPVTGVPDGQHHGSYSIGVSLHVKENGRTAVTQEQGSSLSVGRGSR